MKAKKWRESIMRALARKCGSVDQGLDAAATKLAELAIDMGEQWALKEIGDRIDGKPAQAIVGDDDHPPIKFEKLVREIVSPNANDSDG